MRRFAYGTLLDPEFTLRQPPRITVRGQTVQSDSVPLRKAPLRSRACSWSTKHPCAPLAFRRATEGSRVLRKGRGVKRGRETLVSLPLLSPPGDPGIPGRRRRPLRTPSEGVKSPPPAAPLYRRKVHRQQTVNKRHGRPNGGKSPPSAEEKIFFIFPLDRFVLLYYYHSTT